MTTQELAEYATDKAESLTFTEFISDDELITHFKNEMRKFILREVGDAGIPLISDSEYGDQIEDAALTKMAIFWLQFHNLIILKGDEVS